MAVVMVLVAALAVFMFVPVSKMTAIECSTPIPPHPPVDYRLHCTGLATPAFDLLGCGLVYSHNITVTELNYHMSNYASIQWFCKPGPPDNILTSTLLTQFSGQKPRMKPSLL